MPMPKRRRLVLLACAATAALSVTAAPAGAACVTAGADVPVATVQRTILPHGTCVVSTPLPRWRTDTFYFTNSAAEVNVTVGTVSP